VEANDRFGAALVAGDTDGDHADELVIGAPGEAIGARGGAGMIAVFRGGVAGLRPGSAFDQNHAQIPGAAEDGDSFGSDLALVDLNRDGRRDLVVGVSGETVGAAQFTGLVEILYSGAGGPSAAGTVALDQNSPGVPGANEENDGFGTALGRLVNAYGGDALVVAAPDEKVSYDREGAVTVLPGARAGASRPAGYFFTGANFPRGAVKDGSFGTGLS
jgi:hypothetical protein